MAKYQISRRRAWWALTMLWLLAPACKTIPSNESVLGPAEGNGQSTTFSSQEDGVLDDRPIGSEDVSNLGSTVIAGHPKPWDLWIDPQSPAALAAKSLRSKRDAASDLLEIIATHAVASWYSGSDPRLFSDLRAQMSEARAQNQYALIVVDNLPYRDCSSSGNGAAADSYRSWIKKFSAAMDGGGKAIVIYEPSGIARIECLGEQQRNERLTLMNEAMTEFKRNRELVVYIDVSNETIKVDQVVAYLRRAGIDKAAGFALNTARYQLTKACIERGKALRKALPDKNYVIDTSRNGNGIAIDDNKCNPRGRALGEEPTTGTGIAGLDAYLWVKQPGESDGECERGDPPFGVFSPSLAAELVKRAGY